MNICESYLASLAEITASIEKFEIEQDRLIEIGCYFYRAASVISEVAEISPENSIGILQSLLRNSHLAKGLLGKLQESGENTFEAELKNTIQELGGIINHIGEDLSSVPISAFKNKKYIEIAVCSLSEEMRGSPFRISPVPESKPIPEIKASYQRWESNLKDASDIESTQTDADDCSVSTEVRAGYSHISDMPHLLDALRSTSQGSHISTGNRIRRSSANSSRKSQHAEPLYNSFICPLTKVIMDDPVTIQSGVTYERKAITEYFESFGSEEVLLCPVTMEKVEGKNMNPNIALRNTINEWKDRDETSRLRVIHEALSIDNTDDKLLEALTRLKVIWKKSPQKVLQVRNITPLIVRLLEVKSRNVRCAALEMICLLAHVEEQKEIIGKTSAIPLTVRLLSSSYQPMKHGVLLLLIELSKSKSLSEKIGCITGGILILIRTKYNRSSDTFASEAANQVLKNLEQFSDNIKIMADNGYLEPLLNNLIEGVEEKRLEMVTYLGETILEDDCKPDVAKKTSPILAEMMQNGDPSTRLAVFKALTQISSHTESGRILVTSGIIGTMVQEIFSTNIFNGPIDTFREALAVLTNILESGVELENLMVNSQGNTRISGYILFNIIYMIKSSTPEDLKMSLVQILYHMAKSTKTAAQVLSAVKESEVSYTLLELLNNPRDEIAISAIKLLTLLLSQMGNLLIERLCQTNGLPEGLVQSRVNPAQYTERQALSATFLAKVPHQNVTLNLALVRRNTIPGILQSISQILRSGARHEKYARMYLEGLVGTVVRTTATLYEPQMLHVAMDYNFTLVLTELLSETSSDEVQRLAATGLEKLSSQSVHLSRKPQKKRKKFLNLFYLPKFLLFESSRKTKIKLCIVHKGVCFGQNTMCLIEAKAVERLLKCLEHENAEVAEAALSAISTLLDDKVDLKQSVKMLSEMNAIQQVLKAIRRHKIESLWQKAFWMMERFLTVGGQSSIAIVSQDKLFSVTVVTAFHHGDAYTKQMAEKILRYTDRMPNYTDTFTM